MTGVVLLAVGLAIAVGVARALDVRRAPEVEPIVPVMSFGEMAELVPIYVERDPSRRRSRARALNRERKRARGWR